jgi:hypothetical protein
MGLIPIGGDPGLSRPGRGYLYFLENSTLIKFLPVGYPPDFLKLVT